MWTKQISYRVNDNFNDSCFIERLEIGEKSEAVFSCFYYSVSTFPFLCVCCVCVCVCGGGGGGGGGERLE